MKMNVEVVKAWHGTHYCGRPSSYKPSYGVDCSALGNPFPMSNRADGSRDAVCDKYASYLSDKILSSDPDIMNALGKIIKDLNDGMHVKLGCFCAPLRCHCSSIKDFLDNASRSNN